MVLPDWKDLRKPSKDFYILKVKTSERREEKNNMPSESYEAETNRHASKFEEVPGDILFFREWANN